MAVRSPLASTTAARSRPFTRLLLRRLRLERPAHRRLGYHRPWLRVSPCSFCSCEKTEGTLRPNRRGRRTAVAAPCNATHCAAAEAQLHRGGRKRARPHSMFCARGRLPPPGTTRHAPRILCVAGCHSQSLVVSTSSASTSMPHCLAARVRTPCKHPGPRVSEPLDTRALRGRGECDARGPAAAARGAHRIRRRKNVLQCRNGRGTRSRARILRNALQSATRHSLIVVAVSRSSCQKSRQYEGVNENI